MSGEIRSPQVEGEQDPRTFKSELTNMEPDGQLEENTELEAEPQAETEQVRSGLMVKILENKAVVKGILIAGAFGTMIGGMKSAEASGNKAIEMMKLRDGVNQHVIANTLKHMSPESVRIVDGKEIVEGEIQLGENLVSYWKESPTNLKNIDKDHQKEAVSHWKAFQASIDKNPQMKALIGKEVKAVAEDFLSGKVDEDSSFKDAKVQDLVDRVKSAVLKVYELAKSKGNPNKITMEVENTLLEIATDKTAAAAQVDNIEQVATAEQ